jgi:hypothetical protein
LKVNSKGKITPTKKGKKIKKKKKVSITVTAASGIKKKITVYIVPKVKKLKKIKVKFPKTLKRNKTKQLKVKLYPSSATNVKIKFKSSKKSGLFVDKSGLMIAKKKGKKYRVTVKAGKKKVRSKKIKVK